MTAPSVKAEAVGKIEQTAHPTHENAIVKKMKIFKTCILNDDKKGVQEILKQTDDLKNLENLQKNQKIKFKLLKKQTPTISTSILQKAPVQPTEESKKMF